MSNVHNNITIRNLNDSDPKYFAEEEIKQGWNSSEEKFIRRLNDAEAKKCISIVAEFDGQPAGYVNVYFQPDAGSFAGQDIPVIVDFAVLQKFRRLGIGTALMDTAEEIAKERCDKICIAVGLHSGYGAAQALYIKRGFVPDGTGVWYKNKVCEPYSECRNDDDLLLHMWKEL